MMTNLPQPILGKFGRNIKPERWIFVIGSYNSGTTLLASILRNHSLIGGLRTEGAFLTDALPYPEKFGWPRMWCMCLDKIQLKPEPNNAVVADRIKRQWSLWFPRHTPNLVEKTVSNAARIPFLETFFKPAYFIYIVRNGYAVAGGIQLKANLRRWKNSEYDRYPIELCAQQWRVTDEIVERDSKAVTNFLQIYYEELVSMPNETVRKVTDFLGIAPLDEDSLAGDWVVHGVKSTIRDMNRASLQRLSNESISGIEKIAGERLKKHGYTHPDENEG